MFETNQLTKQSQNTETYFVVLYVVQFVWFSRANIYKDLKEKQKIMDS